MNLTSQNNRNGARLPEHLIQRPGGEWNVWQWVCVRSAGFPADVVKSHIQLSPVQYRLLQLCDGKRPAKKIAREILRDSACHLTEETEIYQHEEFHRNCYAAIPGMPDMG